MVNPTWVNHTAMTAPAPPASINSLGNTTYQPTYIRWTWNDPVPTTDFDHVQVFLNGVEQAPVAKGTGIFNATGLTPNTSYTLGTRTVGTTGVINATWVNHHCDDSTGSSREHHEPPQHHVPADQYHLELD